MFGDVTISRMQINSGGFASSTRGVFAGGATPVYNSYSNVIDYVTFSTKGKATDLTYTLMAVAEPPEVGSTGTTYATSIHKEGSLVYVTWHTKNAPFGGAVSVYDVSTPGAISYISRVDFIDTDFHDGVYYNDGANKYFYVVGQRDRNVGAYYNDSVWHFGAIFGRITLTGTGDLTSTYSELPLAGHAGNGVALGADYANMQVITGDSASTVYKINGSTMSKIDSTSAMCVVTSGFLAKHLAFFLLFPKKAQFPLYWF